MQKDLQLSSYHYHLPEELIAQFPADKRDQSRLLVFNTTSDEKEHRQFCDIIEYINEDDMLVVNNTEVFPARLHGRKETGGKVEVLLLEFPKTDATSSSASATGLLKSSKRVRPGTVITISQKLSCEVLSLLGGGKAELSLKFDHETGLSSCLEEAGQVPLPPYIVRKEGSTREDQKRYQTIYATEPGAVAAPTAGLHFTEDVLARLKDKNITIGTVTLHVGYGTFAPVRQEDITQHQIHKEFLTIPEETVRMVEETKKRGGKIWAVGTTSIRALEYGAQKTGELEPIKDWCDLYIYPGFDFKVVDNVITNFHLPDSSLMFLVSALCDRKALLDCYKVAIKKGYRFFSYGDAMAIIRR